MILNSFSGNGTEIMKNADYDPPNGQQGKVSNTFTLTRTPILIWIIEGQDLKIGLKLIFLKISTNEHALCPRLRVM
jgi:hypothetical protein